MTWYFWVGLIAAACIAIYCMPQLIHVMRTKNTCGISIWMLILMIAGDLFFVIDAIGIFVDPKVDSVSAGLPLFLANFISLVVGVTLLVFKLRALHYAKVFKTTEKLFCDNYEGYRTKIKMSKAEKIAQKQIDKPEEPTTPVTPIVG